MSLAACCGSSFVRDLKIDETNEVENAYGIFIRNLQFFLDFVFTILFKWKFFKKFFHHDTILWIKFHIFNELIFDLFCWMFNCNYTDILNFPYKGWFVKTTQTKKISTTKRYYHFSHFGWVSLFCYKFLKAKRGTFLQT